MSTFLINHYHFKVEWGGSRIDMLEVSGLDIEVEAISYRDGSSPEEIETKIPGLTRYPEVSLKRNILKGDNEFFYWINTKRFGQIERRDITISLLNENHEPVIIWKLRNCFPVKYIGPVLLSNNSGTAIETLVITHEGLVVETVK